MPGCQVDFFPNHCIFTLEFVCQYVTTMTFSSVIECESDVSIFQSTRERLSGTIRSQQLSDLVSHRLHASAQWMGCRFQPSHVR
jgi:hypothetical protein